MENRIWDLGLNFISVLSPFLFSETFQSKRLDEAKRIIQEQQKRIGALSEMKGELNGIVTEQRKALERLKFGAVEAETLHGATKEQITKALTFVKEGFCRKNLHPFHKTHIV